MGSFDGAEICEIVGLYILDQLINSNIGLTMETTGLYRDDGLVATALTNQQAENIIKAMRNLFDRNCLKIKVSELTKSVDYLDVRMHMETGEYEPYRKEETLPKYINKESRTLATPLPLPATYWE